MTENKYSKQRKKLQEEGLCPDWWSTGGYQLFVEKYQYQASNPKEQYERIASTLAVHTPNPGQWKEVFFDLMWKGWLSPSTPVLANTGTNRGLPVSCAGSYIGDSIDSIYNAKHETAILTKMGFGTAGYLGDVRPRGTDISVGGKAMGVLPVLKGFQSDMEYVAQGSSRRGSWAGYLPIDHGDFHEVVHYLESEPDGNNIGWCVSQEFIDRLKSGDREALDRYQTVLRTKMITGKGYFFFPDKAADKRPQWYKDLGLDVKAPQLCVAPETKILTDKGYQTISTLQDRVVKVWNGEEWSEVTVRKTGENQKLVNVVIYMECGERTSLRCTPYHKWYDVNGNELQSNQLERGIELLRWKTPDGTTIRHKVLDVVEAQNDDTYCFTEPKRNMGVFNGILTGNCNEITLHSSEDYTYTCVLASMNLLFWDDWKDTDAVFNATVFLDCVVQEFLERGKNIPGLEKAIAATKKGRALGLGVMGLHTLFQTKMMAFEGLEAYMLNRQIFKHIRDQAESATKWLGETWGEPEWCKGYGRANTHCIAIAPTKSTALIMGGVSEGINPDTAMAFIQRTPAGEISRVNPILLNLMKEKGVYSKKNVTEVIDAMGSVQNVEWLTDEEKSVFRTAFEINQSVVLRLAKARACYIDQWQSLNLFFSSEEDESYISQVHQEAFEDPDILGLYYVYSKAGIQASKDECLACQ